MFFKNSAIDGGAILSNSSCITFKRNSTAVFHHNNVKGQGGAIASCCNGYIISESNTSLTFSNNIAYDGCGGAMYSFKSSYIVFERNSPMFSNNAGVNGGAICSYDNSYIVFEGKSSSVFNKNTALNKGAATYIL